MEPIMFELLLKDKFWHYHIWQRIGEWLDRWPNYYTNVDKIPKKKSILSVEMINFGYNQNSN